jgi:transcription factor E
MGIKEEYLAKLEPYLAKDYLLVLEVLIHSDISGERKDENLIAQILKKDVHDVRKILYHLQNQNLVFSKFWKVNEKGWYVNSWHVNFKEIERFLESKKSEEKEISSQIFSENSNFVCSFCNTTFDYFEAMENSFICSNCGAPLESLADYKVQEEFVYSEGEKIQYLQHSDK